MEFEKRKKKSDKIKEKKGNVYNKKHIRIQESLRQTK